MKSETDDGLSNCSYFPERPSSYELEPDKPVLPEIEHLKGKICEGDFELLREVLNRNADLLSKHKADFGCSKACRALSRRWPVFLQLSSTFRRYVLPGECCIDVFMALLGVIFF